MLTRRPSIPTLLVTLFLASTAFAEQSDAFVDALLKVRTFHQVAISPDGKRVAWSERDHGISVSDVGGANRKQLTTGDDEGLAWSPDSARLAYAAKKGKQSE